MAPVISSSNDNYDVDLTVIVLASGKNGGDISRKAAKPLEARQNRERLRRRLVRRRQRCRAEQEQEIGAKTEQTRKESSWFRRYASLLVLSTTFLCFHHRRHRFINIECRLSSQVPSHLGFVEAFTTLSTTTMPNPRLILHSLTSTQRRQRQRRRQSSSTTTLHINGISPPQDSITVNGGDEPEKILFQQHQESQLPGYRLSPYHVIYPEAFTEEQIRNQTLSETSKVSLFEGLRLMRQALNELVERANKAKASSVEEEHAHHDDDGGDGDDDAHPTGATKQYNTKAKKNRKYRYQQRHRVVRIEQAISHSVDPLCWLHSQVENHRPTRRDRHSISQRQHHRHPVFYFATAEGILETAVFGSSYTHSYPLVTGNDIDDTNDDNAKQKNNDNDNRTWNDLISKLPDRARLYGGQRFDTSTDIIPPSEEWESFGQALWILPAIEVRRESKTTTISVHLVADDEYGTADIQNDKYGFNSFKTSAQYVLSILEDVTDHVTPAVPPTNLPPVLSRSTNYKTENECSQGIANSNVNMDTSSSLSSTQSSSASVSLDGQEIYERGVSAALQEFGKKRLVNHMDEGSVSEDLTVQSRQDAHALPNHLSKVVLARRLDLNFADQAYAQVKAIDILRKWRFSTQPGGHLFYMCPDINAADENEFFGCTPERLFQVKTTYQHLIQHDSPLSSTTVVSEALAGTRPRGSTIEADHELSRQLFGSLKDQDENQITGKFIEEAFGEMERRGWILNSQSEDKDGILRTKDNTSSVLSNSGTIKGDFFVRRLRHLQHICQRFQCTLSSPLLATEAIRYLVGAMHPTPAVNGYPKAPAMKFIRTYERIGFDRGFYAGPLGFVGRSEADIVVSIRSGLVNRRIGRGKDRLGADNASVPSETSRVSVYAGAGIVPGSTVQGEWAETSYKLAVVSSIFPQSPITLQNEPTPNTAWASAFVEELIRNGITNFYICPGSRSTPLVTAIARALRSNVGVVHALSIHDERGAGFRALGYGRSGRPAAVITSSGTAIANLYPAIVEASMDAVPMLVITADRPYESRDSGSNQAIDQVKAYSQTYIRWFRDILPPNDDIPVSVALADAAHAVSISRQLKGPVHINVQFRENLAPEAGQIRNDDRRGSVTSFDNVRFTDTPGFHRWSMGGRPWTTNSLSLTSPNHRDVQQVVDFILKSKRGIIVVGNTRKTTENGTDGDSSHVNQLISNFAQTIGFPIFASSLAADLRFQSPAVVLYAEHILRCPLVHNNLKPDLILQFGAPLISTELPKIVKSTIKQGPTNHILIHPRHPSERTDPEFTVSQAISADIGSFIRDITTELDRRPLYFAGSELAPMVVLGRLLQREMPRIVDEATSSRVVKDDPPTMLTEPQVMLEMSKIFNSEVAPKLSLFISNSMPVRDAEAFLYPLSGGVDRSSLSDVGVNRGASGIDGVIASAAGFADSTGIPTTLIIGDVAALHDINSLHSLKTAMSAKEAQAQKIHPLTTIVLNNNGGGIFSFLPIAKHGNDVSFDEFFGTPTNTFSFQKGVEAFDIPFKRVHNTSSLADAYIESIKCTEPTIIEALVATREENVKIHQTISSATSEFIVTSLESAAVDKTDAEMLPVTISSTDGSSSDACNHPAKTMVLLHGWMGDRDEWSEVVERLTQTLPSGWNILTFDLPGHGKARHLVSSKMQLIRRALHVGDEDDAKDLEQFSLDALARSVCATLNQMNITSVDALGGYSLGGRVALAMKRLSMTPSTSTTNMPGLLNDATRMILVSCNVGVFGSTNQREAQLSSENIDRLKKDEELYTQMQLLVARGMLSDAKPQTETMIWSDFLRNWYSASLWGSVSGNEQVYPKMLERRMASLAYRGLDHAKVLRQCSPPRCSAEDWRGVKAQDTLLLVGSMDNTYCKMGRQWADLEPSLGYVEIPERGHALLVEDPVSVADEIANFIVKHRIESDKDTEKKIWNTTFIPSPSKNREGRSTLSRQDLQFVSSIASLDFEGFSVDLVDKRSKQKSVSGIGWGETARVDSSTSTTSRQGVILQVVSRDGLFVGLGEVSPLQGLHPESLAEAEMQLETIATVLSKTDPSDLPSFDAKSILGLDGALHSYISSLLFALACDSTVYRSVWAGLEMAILSIASQVVRLPMHEAILANAPSQYETTCRLSMLPLNGLIRRSSDENQPIRIDFDPSETAYPSWKIKVGHQTLENDVKSIKMTVSQIPDSIKIRADANRGFSDDQFRKLACDLAAERDLTSEKIEYIEEPLSKQQSEGFPWTLEAQVNVLEMLYNDAGIPYALDESMYDLLLNHGSDCEKVLSDLRNVFARGSRGCAAFVLKPSLLGLEVSMRIARLARSELGIGAVFTSSFDTGIGLAYASFLASLSDATKSKPGALLYAHGLSTFELMHPDCLSPSFGSYVSNTGIVNVASISRALYGLGIDELQSLSLSASPPALPLLDDSVGQSIEDVDFSISVFHPAGRQDDDADKTQTSLDIESSGFMSDEFVASTSSSRNGRDIVVVASLPLPFSPIIGASRFTDLPQQPRWSPWLASVAYLDAPGSETEWTLRVRGVSFRWRARSEILQKPYRGIRWKSTSGVKNTGAVEFVPAPGDPNKCYMRVRMAFVTPRLMSSLFRGTVLEDFLRNKILKWSLESFRDVVLGDLALEEGNVELGDALFGAVEGKTSAIEEAFLPVPSLDKDTT